VAAGFDIRFGRGRAGDADTLRRLGEELGFEVTIVPRVDDGFGGKLSSTAVRAALTAGVPQAAAEILGRPFAIQGVVRQGRGLGRRLGFPTANLPLDDYVRPRPGIYAAYARLQDGRRLAAVAYIGSAATVGAPDERLEVWIFDFDEDLYGQTLETELIAFVRPDATFTTVAAMADQVREDARRARELLSYEGGG
jgi:riboflavin kinase / FMN adenylyltransferase